MRPIVFVWGTRPESLKIGAVVAELKALGVPPQLLSTGQHTDLLAGTPAETDLADGQSLGLASGGNVIAWLSKAHRPLQDALKAFQNPLVVVQGDTMSALAGARAAHSLGLEIAHVEAGIRSWKSEPWPEESFRKEITQLATWHYAPTAHTCANLRRDGIPTSKIKLTGNPIVSAIARYSDAKPQPAVTPHHVLITLHRRELFLSLDLLPMLQHLAFELARNEDIHFLWPLHPAMSQAVYTVSWPPNVTFSGPLPYRLCIEGLARCYGVITDSGGLQEESATLGVPCLVLRRFTDRPESVESGMAKVIPPDRKHMENLLDYLQKMPRKPSNTFGTPSAASLIAQHLASQVQERHTVRQKA